MIIFLKDNSKIEIPEGSSAKDLAESLKLNAPNQAVGVNINGIECDLTQTLNEGDHLIFWNFEDHKGKEVFWHTSAHVLAQAILRLWPDAKPTIGPPIENGFYYDFANIEISDNDFSKIEEEMQSIVSENFKSERVEISDKEEAIKYFGANKYKAELIENFGPDDKITGYRQGEFFDLCRGPHLYNLGKIKALKILKTSGAYWRGDSKNEMLTRIYGITFPDRKQLKQYLLDLEEAKKRDHKILGPKLDLFSLHEEAPGMPFIHPKGVIIWNELLSYLRECLREANYVEIKTPSMMTKDLWVQSGHWNNYREHMYVCEVEKREFAIKPMNCPGCLLYYKTHIHSYRDLPFRVSEIGNVHRFESSGALSGLMRVRSFHQDDAHIFMKTSDIHDEILSTLRLVEKIYKTFGLEFQLELSTKPEKNTIGTDEEWEIATRGLKGALDNSGRSYKINEGDGAFYGPKIDFHIRDALNRTWQCGTIQLDMALPERFELEYTAQDGSRKRPVMIHRTIYGAIERFLGVLIEHFAGRFPLWLSPHQIRLITVADRHAEYAFQLCEKFRHDGFHCDVDDTNESVSKKIRIAQLAQINYILTIGDKELEHQTINLRTRENQVLGELKFEDFLENIKNERNQRSLTSPYAQEKQTQMEDI